LKRLLEKLSLLIFNILTSKNPGRTEMGMKVSKHLSALNPTVRTSVLLRDYYVKKITNIIMAAVAGLLLIVLLIVNENGSKKLLSDNSIRRNEFGKGNSSYELSVKSGDYDYGIVDVEVSEQKKTDEELNKLLNEFVEQLFLTVLNGNESFSHVDSDLNTVRGLDGYPFTVRWELSDYEILNEDGSYGRKEAGSKGEPVTLRAVIKYEDKEWVYEREAVIFPRSLNEEEKKEKLLRDTLNEYDSKSRNEAYMYLPDTIDGIEVTWEEKKEHHEIILLVVISLLLIGIWKGTDRDLSDRYEKRNQALLIEYAEIVSELEMLLSSGMTIRGALEKMNENYKKAKERNGNIKYAYEELRVCIKKIKDGANESTCYEYWGNRCELICYRKLSSLLIQNIRKGNSGLINALSNETKIAFEERKAGIRRKGEEAQTKLLFPMILMLGVVMIIIMIPAYFSFGI